MNAKQPDDGGLWILVDESKSPEYVMAAVHVERSDVPSVRMLLRGFLLGGQSRLHMAKENRRRQRMLASFLLNSGLRIVLYQSSSRIRPRDAIVRRLALDAYDLGAVRLVIEEDVTTAVSDAKILYDVAHSGRGRPTLRYEHLPARSEPLLWLPDMAAWMWNSSKYRGPTPFEVIRA